MKLIQHLKTVHHHRALVRKYCFRLGLYWQGLTHDLSKYSWTELRVGAKYFQGDRSPNDAERRTTGLSTAWLHHKGRNKHHLEYWIDYSLECGLNMAGIEMPARYVAEMFCDRVAASQTYRKGAYTNEDPYIYFQNSLPHYIIHPKTAALLEEMLLVLKDQGEEAALRHIRKDILGK